MLGLLYDARMTHKLTEVIMENYDSLVLCMTKQSAEEHNRLHVQLFPTADLALRAVREMRALPAMLFTLKAILALSCRKVRPNESDASAVIDFDKCPLMDGIDLLVLTCLNMYIVLSSCTAASRCATNEQFSMFPFCLKFKQV